MPTNPSTMIWLPRELTSNGERALIGPVRNSELSRIIFPVVDEYTYMLCIYFKILIAIQTEYSNLYSNESEMTIYKAHLPQSHRE